MLNLPQLAMFSTRILLAFSCEIWVPIDVAFDFPVKGRDSLPVFGRDDTSALREFLSIRVVPLLPGSSPMANSLRFPLPMGSFGVTAAPAGCGLVE